MTVQQITSGSILDLTFTDTETVPCTLYWEGSGSDRVTTATGLLATLVFEMEEGIGAGQYPVYISTSGPVEGDRDDVPVEVFGGVIVTGLRTADDIVSTVTIEDHGTTYRIRGVVLEKPLFVRVSDPACSITVHGNGSAEDRGDGLYRIILKEDGCTLSVSGNRPVYTVTLVMDVADHGTIHMKTITVPDGTTWSVSDGTVSFSDGRKVVAKIGNGDSEYTYRFLGWTPGSGTVDSDRTLTASFDRKTRQYNVTFVSEGSVLSTAVCDHGSTVMAPAEPMREGHTFTGWYIDDDCTETFDFGAPVTRDIDLYAGWDRVTKFDVTFDYNDGTGRYETVTVDAGSTVDLPPHLEKLYRPGYGYVSAWYSNASHVQVWDFGTDTVHEDIVLYAGWVSLYALVRFYVDGSEYGSVNTLVGKPLGRDVVAEPVKKLHTFTGWYSDSSLTVGWNLDDDPVTEDMRLYASYVSDALYNPAFYGERSYIGGMTLDGRTYYIEYGGTLHDVVIAPLYKGASKVSPGGTFRWTKQEIAGEDITRAVRTVFNADDPGSWNVQETDSFVAKFERVSDESKKKFEKTLSDTPGYGGSVTSGEPHSYGYAQALSYYKSIQADIPFDLGCYDIGTYVTYVIVGDVDVFAAYYVEDDGDSVSKVMFYSTYGLSDTLIQMDSPDGYRTTFGKYVDHSLYGDGTSDVPFLIRNALDLCMVRENPDKCFVMETDIGLDGIVWVPIPVFEGTFDGNGHRISDFRIDRNPIGDGNMFRYGIFDTVHLGTVSNLHVEGELKLLWKAGYGSDGKTPVDREKYVVVGMISAYLFGGTMVNCSSSGSIDVGTNDSSGAYGTLGGLTGDSSNSTMKGCHNYTFLRTRTYSNIVGGITGKADNTHIEDCHNHKNTYATSKYSGILGSSSSGGIVGQYRGNERIVDCSNDDLVIVDTNSVKPKGDQTQAYAGWVIGVSVYPVDTDGCWNDGSAYVAHPEGVSKHSGTDDPIGYVIIQTAP
ncbi:MAG: InlB B-repeat-containing protein, partial [archaeon]|nr:InlB B-repeat-containing protein [archaeon]